MVHFTDLPQADLSEIKPKGNKQLELLIIDDNVNFSSTLSFLLNLIGYQTTICDDGMTGLETGKQRHPDAILLDIRMPDMDGFETCRLIREESWGKSLPILAITGYYEDDLPEKSAQAGFTSHFAKTLDVIRLRQHLSSYLDNHLRDA